MFAESPGKIDSGKIEPLAKDNFKKAMGRFATGVTIITTQHEGKFYGLTANSFSSVSLEPCLISFCLNRAANSFTAFSKSDYFTVNILTKAQQSIAELFAKSQAAGYAGEEIDKFTQFTDYQLGPAANSPVINGCLAVIECRKYQQIKAGDHDIFIGQGLNVNVDEEKSPLLYYAKSYQRLD